MPLISPKDPKLYERVIEGVRRYIEQHIIPRLKPVLVILYGSFARGDYTGGSDIDLLIVADNIPTNYWDRWSLAYEVIEGFPTDPHIYTPEEFRTMLIDGRMTPLDALTEGIKIYAEPKYMQEINMLLSETLKRRIKHEGMWITREYLQKLSKRENKSYDSVHM